MSATTHHAKLSFAALHRFLRYAGVVAILLILATVAEGAPMSGRPTAQITFQQNNQ